MHSWLLWVRSILQMMVQRKFCLELGVPLSDPTHAQPSETKIKNARNRNQQFQVLYKYERGLLHCNVMTRVSYHFITYFLYLPKMSKQQFTVY